MLRLDTPKTEAEIAETLKVSRPQAKEWLARRSTRDSWKSCPDQYDIAQPRSFPGSAAYSDNINEVSAQRALLVSVSPIWRLAPMEQYVDLGRRFRTLSDAELAEPERLAELRDFETVGTLSWEDLLRTPRVVLLAEAGSGKTWEMEEQTRAQRRKGKAAFFFPLESLAREAPGTSLSAAEERDFASWIADGSAPGWFFLDSVDELKLTQGTLRAALNRFAKAIDGQLARAYVTVSSRPSDWKAQTDLTTLTEILPFVADVRKLPTPEEAFLRPLRHEPSKDSPQEVNNRKSLLIVSLLPLSRAQMEAFSVAKGTASPSALMAEIDRQDAWSFTTRPLDLSELLAFWKSQGRLGNRREQHEANIETKLRDDPERPGAGILSEAQARSGAERLALALALTRRRTFLYLERAIDQQGADEALDPASVLPDWTPDQRGSLLRRALFDPATYGRVRFHHRSVQEYLAACRLAALRNKGMSIRALSRLLLAERYGTAVVIPSQAPIAAWCALWSPEVRREIMRREPELLLQQGDPASLPVEERAALLRAFANTYAEGKWRGMDIDKDSVRRLGHPDLTEVVRELWSQGPTNDDVIDLLLKLIWQGRLTDCEEIAKEAAFDEDQGPYTRILGIWALAAIGARPQLRQVAEALLARPDRWPDRVVTAAAPELFPHSLSLDELVALIERTPQPSSSIQGFRYALRGIALEIEPASDQAAALRERIRQMIWDHRGPELYWYSLHSRFSYLTPALAALCARQIESLRDPDELSAILRCSVLALRFGEHETPVEKDFAKLHNLISANIQSRSIAFWHELDLLDAIAPGQSDQSRWIGLSDNGSAISIDESDRPWLLHALSERFAPARRGIALEALVQLWYSGGQQPEQIDDIKTALADDPPLNERWSASTTPRTPSPEQERLDRKWRRHKCLAAARERQRLQKWEEWRDELCADPVAAFFGDRCFASIANLHDWLQGHSGSITGRDCWNESAISEAFGDSVATAARNAFMRYWRDRAPLLWSQRPKKDRNAIEYAWLYGLCGVYAESETPGWSSRLSPEEARIAAAYAAVEINGFPRWLEELAQTHSREVDAVLGEELTAQLAMVGEIEHITLLQDIAHATIGLKRLFARRILDGLHAWPSVIDTDKQAGHACYALARSIDILAEVLQEADRECVAALCLDRVKSNPAGRLAPCWLRGLFRFDSHRGAETLDAVIDGTPEVGRSQKAVEIFASVFSDQEAVPVAVSDSALRVGILRRLLRLCYRHVAPDDDQAHEGVYTPNARDKAQRVRSSLLSALLYTPGAEAYQAILELAEEPDFSRMRDRILLMAREKAATDAEPSAFSISALRAIEQRFEAPPHDRDSLFDVMMDRLADLQHEIAHDDFTDRRTLQKISLEAEMQRTLARRLRDAARGAYSVSREDEVADLKRTDIRLTTTSGMHRAAIEIKIADKRWSLADFERALETQLVGQYLRDDAGRAGCLLLTFNGDKDFWNEPASGDQLSFEAVCDRLKERAQQLEAQRGFEIRLGIIGLDLRDPPL